MDPKDKNLLLKLVQDNKNIARHYAKHIKYKEKLLEFTNKNFLTEAEQIEQKKLKFEKLQNKDKIVSLLRDCESEGIAA